MADLALAIVPLFNNALDWFRFIRVANNTKRDTETYQLRLDFAGLRLSRWGKSVGLDDCTELPNEFKICERALMQINELFQNAGNDKSTAGSNAETMGLNEGLKSLYLERRNNNFTHKITNKAKWAMYKRDECETLASNIENPVESLINIFPQDDKIIEQLKVLCEEEVRKLEEADHELFKELRETINKHDVLLREALERNEKGATHDNRATFGEGNRACSR